MKETKKCDESRQLNIKSGHLQKDRVELERYAKTPSISMTSKNRQNARSEYHYGLLEKIISNENLNEAFKRVKKNKGSHGIDEMGVDELLPYLKRHGEELKQSIVNGSYKPNAVRRVEIPKENGKTRPLGIPTVVDRVIQQAISQVLTPIFEKKFSENSYGFRPNRNAHQAILKCKEYMDEGYRWAVDIDLEKYFDTVNHDKLIGLIYKEVKDIRVIGLIRKYLNAGVMEKGLTTVTTEGVPQGGNLSPLLSNIMLHELDTELERRGLRFCRYADDCNVYVKSRKSAERVMKSITKFIEEDLKLKVNKEKSKVDRPWKLKYLGYTFYPKKGEMGIRVHPISVKKIKGKLKNLTGRSNAMSMEVRAMKLRQLMVGWVSYFKLADMRSTLKELDEWLRRRIRLCYWKQWKKIKTKYDNLVKLGALKWKAWEHANTRKGYWRISNSPILATTLTNKHLREQGFITLTERYLQVR
ncbi:group II intron reverse transcriptase/maturase [Anaerocolumna cellulosilytica]|uniref:Group II intron reverse transcriptase/maturase n=1 Tax=Anaerocolumna cellulosilytica TaxID=433286 RepID=A0A6S6R7X8_9FIRM|nr:group II intron reverse transcriptase/maturase [Anaerocolumna cellulosilytica]MBB5198181.1 group II intron reverse transcriptase/maturase [Anaerocolumna cellulosilytica]BCJ92855.1 group II intron reverse transcriptase/maturase [Anaerocolumna cellulosilytica]BCJ95071.1 group II intron reverse transcriptase/maturase [Anaerocolumna cellulosilytica]